MSQSDRTRLTPLTGHWFKPTRHELNRKSILGAFARDPFSTLILPNKSG